MPLRWALWILLIGPSVLCAQPPGAGSPAGPRDIRGESRLFARLPPRAELSPAQRAEQLTQLRQAYEKSPRNWPAPVIDPGVQWRELDRLPPVKHPDSNPPSAEKEELGRLLFFDPRLSPSGEMACASCHDPDLGWADGRSLAFGRRRKELRRHALSILNAAHQEAFFWDGRAASLEAQAKEVLTHPDEMHSSEEHLQRELGAIPEYAAHFEKAFGDRAITLDRVAMALACFERTIVSGRSRFDAFLKGNKRALSDEAIAGLHVFRTAGRCLHCHHGPNFSDGQFHNLGLSYYGRKIEDAGRFEMTQKKEDLGRFRTPSLRNVLETRPYMHNGQFDLDPLLTLYNNGIPTLMPQVAAKDDPLSGQEKSPLVRPLGLNETDLSDLKAFLQSLSEPHLRIRPPSLPGMQEKPPAG